MSVTRCNSNDIFPIIAIYVTLPIAVVTNSDNSAVFSQAYCVPRYSVSSASGNRNKPRPCSFWIILCCLNLS